MALSDSDRLEALKTQRDELEAQLGSGVSQYKIGNREVRREEVVARLKYLNEQISYLESIVSSADSPTRNRIKLMRRP